MGGTSTIAVTIHETINEKSCNLIRPKEIQSELKTGVANVNESRTLGRSSGPERTDECCQLVRS